MLNNSIAEGFEVRDFYWNNWLLLSPDVWVQYVEGLWKNWHSISYLLFLRHRNIMDQMMDMMVKYADNLEDLVSERTRLLIEEKQKTEDLLNRMLPA